MARFTLPTLSAMPAPPALALELASRSSEPLQRLQQRLAESRRRFALLAPLLPPPLPDHVRAGPLDERSFALLADNAAVAAKLRQLLPTLHQALEAAGCAAPPLRVKVLPRDAGA